MRCHFIGVDGANHHTVQYGRNRFASRNCKQSRADSTLLQLFPARGARAVPGSAGALLGGPLPAHGGPAQTGGALGGLS